MTTENRSAFHRPELDILRFFAFLWVYVVHALAAVPATLAAKGVPGVAVAWIEGMVRAGSYGVDLFFVLSAYLITELLRREKAATGTLDVRAFYVRRILRIWPLYYFFLAAAAFLPLLNSDGALGGLQLASFALFLGNWSFYFLGWVGYVAVPLWSLSVEEQFYLVWPPLMKRLSARAEVVLALALIVTANIVRLVAAANHEGTRRLWTNTFAHLDSIAAGILLSVLLHGRVVRVSRRVRAVLIIAGVSALSVRGHSVGLEPADALRWWPTALEYPLVVLGCTALLVAFLDSGWRSRSFEYLGRISYGLYVYHMTCIYLTDRYLGGEPGLAHAGLRIIVSLGLTIAFAAVSYRLIEQPFLKLKRRFTVIDSRPVEGLAS